MGSSETWNLQDRKSSDFTEGDLAAAGSCPTPHVGKCHHPPHLVPQGELMLSQALRLGNSGWVWWSVSTPQARVTGPHFSVFARPETENW